MLRPLFSGAIVKITRKSTKLDNVLYDIRGPIMDAARQMKKGKKSSSSTSATWRHLALMRLKKSSRT